MRLIMVAALAGLMALPIRAAEIAGAGAAAFQEAVATWLTGNDRESLPKLAMLAAEGNTAARLLIARIEHFDRGPSPWRAALGPERHKELFRVPIDWSPLRPSWLRLEAESGNELAQNLLAARGTEADPALIYALAMAGEYQATDHPTRILALYGSDEQRETLLEQDWLLEGLRPYVAYNLGTPEPRGDGLAALRHISGQGRQDVAADDPDTLDMAGLLALGWGFGSLDPDNPWYDQVANWVLTAEATQPIADACAPCGDEIAACAMTLLALTGGYYEVIRLDSPLESIVPQADFLASPRARLMALRRAALTRAETDELLATEAEIAEVSACAARMIAETRAEY